MKTWSSGVERFFSENGEWLSRGAFWLTAVLLVAAAAYWTAMLWMQVHRVLLFDDAYMFFRYAVNMRSGLGISWNPDGIPTYGETSQLWGLVVLVLSFLPVSMSSALVVGSWLCSVGAVGAISWAVAKNACSAYMSSAWRVAPMVAVPLLLTRCYLPNSVNGMETMLGVLLGGWFVGLALGWAEGRVRPQAVGGMGVLFFLVRPEAALAVSTMVLLLQFLRPAASIRARSWRETLTVVSIVGGGIAFYLGLCQTYFHSALPLSFYVKSQHGYEGYAQRWLPFSNAVGVLAACRPFLLLMALFARRAHGWMVACCLVPALLTFAYLLTVTQIMGLDSRYYVPYLGFFLVPGLLLLDRFVAAGIGSGSRGISRGAWVGHALAAAGVMLLFVPSRAHTAVLDYVDRKVENRSQVYAPVELTVVAAKALPEADWFRTITAMSDALVKPLPRGVTLAATEVGYLGAENPQKTLIDLAGLNDAEIAHHGVSMNALLRRKPDIIWLPHPAYTYQRGVMLSDPALLREYDVIAGAANYGLALRKDSPYRGQIDRQMQVLWDDLYPGYSMSEYRVSAVSWTGQKTTG